MEETLSLETLVPQGAQRELLDCGYPSILFMGPRCTGKTLGMLLKAKQFVDSRACDALIVTRSRYNADLLKGMLGLNEQLRRIINVCLIDKASDLRIEGRGFAFIGIDDISVWSGREQVELTMKLNRFLHPQGRDPNKQGGTCMMITRSLDKGYLSVNGEFILSYV